MCNYTNPTSTSSSANEVTNEKGKHLEYRDVQCRLKYGGPKLEKFLECSSRLGPGAELEVVPGNVRDPCRLVSGNPDLAKSINWILGIRKPFKLYRSSYKTFANRYNNADAEGTLVRRKKYIGSDSSFADIKRRLLGCS